MSRFRLFAGIVLVSLLSACKDDSVVTSTPRTDTGIADIPLLEGGTTTDAAVQPSPSDTLVDGGMDATVGETTTVASDGATAADVASPEVSNVDAAIDADCVQNPRTHLEIINRCTPDLRTRVTKKPSLALLLGDGGLPPLR